LSFDERVYDHFEYGDMGLAYSNGGDTGCPLRLIHEYVRLNVHAPSWLVFSSSSSFLRTVDIDWGGDGHFTVIVI